MQKMKVSNLIFNPIGNSFSIILTSKEYAVQLSDQIRFVLNGRSVELISVCTEDTLRVKIRIDGKIFSIYIDRYMEIKSDGFKEVLYFDENGYKVELKDPDILFKIGMVRTKFVKIDDNMLYITGENFLRSVSEYLILIKNQT